MTTPLPLRAFQWDLARQVERLDFLVGLLPRYADWGYQELYLHLEDAVEYPSLPDVARTDAYSQKELGRLVRVAERAGIRVVPIVNLLGHTQYLVKTRSLRDLNEVREPDGTPKERGQICPLHPRTPEVAELLLRDVAPFCTAGKVHVGLDESFQLGRCPACRREIARIGLAGHFAAHAARLHALAGALGLRLGIWADMLNFLPEAVPLLPAGLIAYDWYYYPFSRHPRVELFNFAERDLATPLRARGIEYWGCPMNGAFRHEPLPTFGDRLANLRSWWARCRRVGAAGFLVTSWESYRLAVELAVAVDAAAAELWLNPGGDHGDEAMLTAGFRRLFGRPGAAAAARTALAADAYPFAGYARWETNVRWDGTAPADAVQAGAELRCFRRLVRRSAPAPLQASLAFRQYLAERDAFLHACREGVGVLRRAAKARRTAEVRRLIARLEGQARAFHRVVIQGRKAARSMWRRTRDPRRAGQNELILAADASRLRTWRGWLRLAGRRPAEALSPSPVFGRWQLLMRVTNFEPAVQRVVVAKRNTDGTLTELCGRHTIEFQARCAGPRARAVRWLSLPVDAPGGVFIVSVHGVGRVGVDRIEATDGVERRFPERGPKRTILGKAAPRSGFPDPAALPGRNGRMRVRFAP